MRGENIFGNLEAEANTMKYNRSSIMTKANSLRRVYGMTKSESLTKAWALVKLADLEERKHNLDLIDCPSEDAQKLQTTIERQYFALRDKTFPRKTIQYITDYGYYSETCTREIIDTHAYDTA